MVQKKKKKVKDYNNFHQKYYPPPPWCSSPGESTDHDFSHFYKGPWCWSSMPIFQICPAFLVRRRRRLIDCLIEWSFMPLQHYFSYIAAARASNNGFLVFSSHLVATITPWFLSLWQFISHRSMTIIYSIGERQTTERIFAATGIEPMTSRLEVLCRTRLKITKFTQSTTPLPPGAPHLATQQIWF